MTRIAMSSRSRARGKALMSASSLSTTVFAGGVLDRADDLHQPSGPVETVHASHLRHPVGVEHHHLPIPELKGHFGERDVRAHAQQRAVHCTGAAGPCREHERRVPALASRTVTGGRMEKATSSIRRGGRRCDRRAAAFRRRRGTQACTGHCSVDSSGVQLGGQDREGDVDLGVVQDDGERGDRPAAAVRPIMGMVLLRFEAWAGCGRTGRC
jgi:hypothetical protein